MKNIYILGTIFILGSLLVSCDFNEEPESSASVSMVFSSEQGLETYAYSFYNELPSRSNAFNRNATIDYGPKNTLSGMEVGAYTVNSSTSWSWTALRNINFFLENNTDKSLSENVRNNYTGIARLFRARFYFDKLVTYGPVPWIEKVFNDSDDPDLYNSQDTRDVIIGHIIDDLDYAYQNITQSGTTNNSTIVNKWTAIAFKSRVCLFEAAWRKYHANDELDFARSGCSEYTSAQLYQLAADAAKEVIEKGPYKLYTIGEYKGGRGAYRSLFISDKAVTTEVMMAIETDKELGLGEQNWWYNSSTYGPHLCMSRKFANTYLNIDGSPYNEKKADGSYKTFVEETTGRDTRMNQTIRGADYTRKNASGNYENTSANFTGHTLTGYQFTKFAMDDVAYDDAATNDNDIPIMRYAEILLNYAEAKAELGTLTDNDWAITIGALRSRAGITGGTNETGTLTTKPTGIEPYIAAYYPDITDPSLLEIRREREIELCLEGFRLNDLKRWNCCNLWVDDPWEGVYIPALNTPLDMNGDGVYDAYFYDTDNIGDSNYSSIGVYVGTNKNNVLNVEKVNGGYFMKYNYSGRSWPVRQYLYPIPEVVIQLNNNNLKQNPGW
ncbi:MAG: RagB/SusD family nutrient uptake outer membrane protein [Phocaeicola sp.]|uniref:RagB/SusD family nutrient uptake outer membrane protein n=1 Tax=Phocaeicola TaxID=909656 RepID=UPI00234F8ACF|nr:RagB/SusD family nutrient uptake outer membrane protein [Phocaeicola oris]MCE2617624.1 RagB/SusD family nutrient uptake outer membrane protein [Phocaeicola oris]